MGPVRLHPSGLAVAGVVDVIGDVLGSHATLVEPPTVQGLDRLLAAFEVRELDVDGTVRQIKAQSDVYDLAVLTVALLLDVTAKSRLLCNVLNAVTLLVDGRNRGLVLTYSSPCGLYMFFSKTQRV